MYLPRQTRPDEPRDYDPLPPAEVLRRRGARVLEPGDVDLLPGQDDLRRTAYLGDSLLVPESVLPLLVEDLTAGAAEYGLEARVLDEAGRSPSCSTEPDRHAEDRLRPSPSRTCSGSGRTLAVVLDRAGPSRRGPPPAAPRAGPRG